MPARRFPAVVAASLALAACSSGDDAAQKPVDPAISAALAGPLLTEPDLAELNGAGRALSGTGVASALVPAGLFNSESVAAAKLEAARLAGGSLSPAPAASSDDKAEAGATLLLSLRRAFGRSACEDGLGWSAVWASRLPEPFAVYPRGHVQDALGSDAQGCRLRGISFRTGVAVNDVIDFYWARATRAGFNPQHHAEGDAHAIHGRKGGTAFSIFVRPGPEGSTAVDLLTSGG
ncbi:hypothetical protein [Novosphingobium sp. TH158]|uniref:hypothetical protein n=1 Tax=Novosphingobium sp. TH158 TaxID=2067455 RepID=UPI000C7B7D69|nr:hypothetical protein [Novosphingobium sp. TH158]PLK26563.1 hypothetical protein C0V78_06410 [Novosphingobium sp. TH158]